MSKKNKSNNTTNDMCAIVAECVDCGDQFIIPVSEQLFMNERGFSLPKRCKKCRDFKKEQSKTIVCSDCGESFTFTANEQRYYKENNLEEPKRCRKCRKARKAKHNGEGVPKEDK